MRETDQIDRQLLNIMQERFPLSATPFAALGAEVGISEAEALRRIGRLKDEKIIRQISAIFDTRSLGYRSSLVAMAVDPARVDQAAEIINRHPGVSHNYRRNHYFNLWFTVAVPPDTSLGLEKTVDVLHRQVDAISTRMLPTLKLFKIAVTLDMTGKAPVDKQSDAAPYSDKKRVKASPPTPEQIEIIRELQVDVPLVPRPFDPMALRLGYPSVDTLFDKLAAMQEGGLFRRYAAILHHRKAGFLANAMGVWKVEPERAEAAGEIMAKFQAVSHCYLRPVYPDWQYPLFSMVHARTVKECEEMLKAIAEKTGLTEYMALYSSKEYKKTRVEYFTKELGEWEATALAAGASA